MAAAGAEVLSKAGAEVDLKRVQEVKTLQSYQSVVIGSAARMEKLLPEALRFAQKHRAALQQVKTAYFSVGMLMNEDTPEHRAATELYLRPLCSVPRRPAWACLAAKWICAGWAGFCAEFYPPQRIRCPKGLARLDRHPCLGGRDVPG